MLQPDSQLLRKGNIVVDPTVNCTDKPTIIPCPDLSSSATKEMEHAATVRLPSTHDKENIVVDPMVNCIAEPITIPCHDLSSSATLLLQSDSPVLHAAAPSQLGKRTKRLWTMSTRKCTKAYS